jgi:hypothetical protein
VVISLKNCINSLKLDKGEILANSKSYAKDWNLLYNLANNHSMSSSTVMKFCTLLEVKVSIEFVKLEVLENKNKNMED